MGLSCFIKILTRSLALKPLVTRPETPSVWWSRDQSLDAGITVAMGSNSPHLVNFSNTSVIDRHYLLNLSVVEPKLSLRVQQQEMKQV